MILQALTSAFISLKDMQALFLAHCSSNIFTAYHTTASRKLLAPQIADSSEKLKPHFLQYPVPGIPPRGQDGESRDEAIVSLHVDAESET